MTIINNVDITLKDDLTAEIKAGISCQLRQTVQFTLLRAEKTAFSNKCVGKCCGAGGRNND